MLQAERPSSILANGAWSSTHCVLLTVVPGQGQVGVTSIDSRDETKRQALGLTRQGCSLMSQKQAFPICLPLCTTGLTPRRPEPMAHRCASLAPSISKEPFLWSAHVIPTRAEWGRDSAAGGPSWACTPSLLYMRPVASSHESARAGNLMFLGSHTFLVLHFMPIQ